MSIVEKMIGALCLSVLFGLGLWWCADTIYERGADDARVSMKSDYDKAKKAADDLIDERFGKLNTKLTEAGDKRQELESQNATLKSELLASARAGAVPMRVHVKPRSVCPAKGADDSATIAGPAREETAELLPETTANILDVGGDSAKDVRDYNELLDIYNKVVEACTAKPAGTTTQ